MGKGTFYLDAGCLLLLETCSLFWHVFNFHSNFSTVQRIGCFKDTARRAIPQLDGRSLLLKGNYKRRRFAIEKCAYAALKRGYRMFGVQDGGWCASGPRARYTFAKYGRSKRCRNGKGGPWANDVYRISGILIVFHVLVMLSYMQEKIVRVSIALNFFTFLFHCFFLAYSLPKVIRFPLTSLFCFVCFYVLFMGLSGRCRVKTTNGFCCVFPFKYRRRFYNKCARNSRGQSWCYTSPDRKRWGFCRGGQRRKNFHYFLFKNEFLLIERFSNDYRKLLGDCDWYA